MRRIWGGVLAVLVLGQGAACILDLTEKHGCKSSVDCLGGRVCVAGGCRVPADAAPPDTAEASTAGDADAATPMDVEAGADVEEAPAPMEPPDAAGPAWLAASGTRYLASGTPNLMFVTSQKLVPKFDSLEAADEKCNDAAHAAGLPGTYRAWLSASGVAARDRIAQARGWVRPDGAPFADSMPDLARGWIFNPPLVDENGREVRGVAEHPVATGTQWNGIAGATCDDWHAGAETQTYAGVTEATNGGWSWGDSLVQVSCTEPMHLYCFGVDHLTVVSVAPRAGKRAFLSDSDFFAYDFDGADAICNFDASKAGLAGTFAALIGTSRVSAASRFAQTFPHEWVRLDGVPLNEPGEDLFLVGPRSPLNLTSRRLYTGRTVFTGGPDPSSPAADPQQTCGDWADTGGFPNPMGMSGRVDLWFSGGPPTNCGRQGVRVYCLEK